MGVQKNPGALAGATGAGNAFQAGAGGKSKVARKSVRGTVYRVTLDCGKAFDATAKGRARWALERLRAAGEAGCTPITEPAPRWSAYVHDLRELGVEIETVHEKHGGEFAGTHGRYVLRCRVVPVRIGGAA